MATTDRNTDASSPTTDVLCPICLDVFSSPKLLPCSHTFCEGCLHDLLRRGSPSRFSCPSCREEIHVPVGGVSKFKTNFYLEPEALDRVRRQRIVCANHPKKGTDLYCTDCGIPVCVTCFATKHKNHDHTDASEARNKLRSQLDEGKPRLSRIINIVNKDIDVAKEERQAMEEKGAALKEIILRRHAVLQAAIDKYRDEALMSVDKGTDSLLSTHDGIIASLHEHLKSIIRLQQQVEQALDTNSLTELQTATKEMTTGRGSEKEERILEDKQKHTVLRPVLCFTGTTDLTLKSLRAYMGRAIKLEVLLSTPEMKLEKHFVCDEGPDNDIYHLCPTTDDKVVVSYEPYMPRQTPLVSVFSTDGNPVLATESATRTDSPSVINQVGSTAHSFNEEQCGPDWCKLDVSTRVTHARRRNGRVTRSTPLEGSDCIFAKRYDRNLVKTFVLKADHSGKASISVNLVTSEEPYNTVEKDICTIECTSPRAFDVDESEQMFVVLEEPQAGGFQRKVLLYQPDTRRPTETYSPPVASFQPSDVCFHTLGGEEFLLVADEINDSIHVVKVENKSFTLLRDLVPGCPQLLQPTALNTDTQGRLWVGCTGGRVLVFKRVLSTDAVEFCETHFVFNNA